MNSYASLAPVSGYGWSDPQSHGDELIGARADRLGRWRIGDRPTLITGQPAGSRSLELTGGWQVAGDNLYFSIPAIRPG